MSESVDAAAVPTSIPAVHMVRPMPGFESSQRFTLVRLDDEGVLCELTSLDEPDIRFLVVPPAPFFPDYAPAIDSDTQDRLQLHDADDALVLLVVTAGSSLASTTANLLAPVVINTRNHQAEQVVLSDADLPVQSPLVTAGV